MITLTVKRLRSLRTKSIGVIGKKHIEPVHFTTRWGIHTFGVLHPIDVLILDNDNHVVKLTQNLKPNRIFYWHPRYKHVIELPSGEIAKKGIAMGDAITLLTIS